MSEQNQASGSGKDAVKNQLDASLLEEASDEGVDVDAIIEEKLTKHDGYSAGTVANFVESDIRRQIEAERAEVIQGLIMGSRDRFGKKWPRRHSIVRSDSEHLEVSAWGGTLPGPGGNDVSIPTGGCAVQLRCSYQQEYDSYQAERIDSSRELGTPELVEGLDEVAVGPSFLSRDDEYEVVVVKGEIRFVNPQTVFAGDDQEDWYDGPVLMEDNRGELQPHLEISVAQDGQTQLRGHLERQKNGRPFIQVPDFQKLVYDAYQERDSAEDQARFVGEGLRGTEVIMVGNVNSYNTSRGDDGDVTHYVDIGLTALVSTEGVEQATLEDAATADEGAETEPSPEPADPQEAADETAPVAQAREAIEQYADLVNVDVDDLSFADVRENIGSLEDTPDVAIKQALGEYAEEADEPEEPDDDSGDVHGEGDLPFDPADETVDDIRQKVKEIDDKETLVNLDAAEKAGKDRKSAKEAISRRASKLDEGDDDEPSDDSETGDGDSPFEAIKDGDTYNCPGTDEDGEDCLAQAGSTGELVGHIFDEHGASGDPAEWIEAQLEG